MSGRSSSCHPVTRGTYQGDSTSGPALAVPAVFFLLLWQHAMLVAMPDCALCPLSCQELSLRGGRGMLAGQGSMPGCLQTQLPS